MCRCLPDVALVDLHMPAPGGIRAVAAIRRTTPRVRVVAMSGDSDPTPALEALRAGAEAFLPKSAEPEALLPPLLAVLDGWAVLPAQLLRELLHSGPGFRVDLDPDERALLRSIAAGRSTLTIADQLHVSERTVKRMTAALLRKLRVGTRAEAAALAGHAGLRAGTGRNPRRRATRRLHHPPLVVARPTPAETPCRAAGRSVLERVLVDPLSQGVGEALGGGQLFAEGVDPGGGEGVEHGEPVEQRGTFRTVGGGQRVEDAEQVTHLVEGEPEGFHPFDHPEAVQVGFGVEAEAAVGTRRRDDEPDLFVVPDGADAQADPLGGLADLHESARCRATCGLRPGVAPGAGHQWPAPRVPARLPWMAALGLFSSTISTVLPRAAYFVVMASRAATEEASQTCARLMSMMTLSGSPA